MNQRCITAQSDFSLTVERQHPAFPQARDLLMRFAELVKCPEYLHTYKITRLSLWNAASLGLASDTLIDQLKPFLKFPLPTNVRTNITDTMALWGLLRLVAVNNVIYLEVYDDSLLPLIFSDNKIRKTLIDPNAIHEQSEQISSTPPFRFAIDPLARGKLKVALMENGLPVEDIAGYQDGTPHPLSLKSSLALREYQKESVNAFYHNNSVFGGSGAIVLPCGAGKTIVGIAIMAKLGMRTLILGTNVTALNQWKRELLDKTDLLEDDIGEYYGNAKNIRAITLATYNILTSRKRKTDPFIHFSLFEAEQWGLIIYDEVHLLPAPIFQATANLQARRRLGLTATLVREDGRAADVFSLIGPKRYEVPWKILEEQGWIARANCVEVSVPFNKGLFSDYPELDRRQKYRRAACNPTKLEAVAEILAEHAGKSILILGMYLEQLRELAQFFSIPLLDGSSPQRHRNEVYAKFQAGEIPILALSKIGNSSVDLPDAQVAIQISGTFGSRQEEAQRLGRILRPKADDNQAFFYSLVSSPSSEEDFALNRQLFLVEQGYSYSIRKYGETVDQVNYATG